MYYLFLDYETALEYHEPQEVAGNYVKELNLYFNTLMNSIKLEKVVVALEWSFSIHMVFV